MANKLTFVWLALLNLVNITLVVKWYLQSTAISFSKMFFKFCEVILSFDVALIFPFLRC
jgi:hypothetical protein